MTDYVSIVRNADIFTKSYKSNISESQKSAFLKYRHMGHWSFFPLSQTCGRASVLSFKTARISKTGNLFPPDSVQFRHFYRKRNGRRKPEKETGWQQQVSLWTWLFFSIKNSQKVLHAQGFRQAHRYYPADDEICPRSERQVPAVSTASPWNQRNSFWISVSSATEYPSFWQMDSICLFGIPVFRLFEFKISDIWQQLGYRTKLRTIGLMALPLVSHSDVFVNHFL